MTRRGRPFAVYRRAGKAGVFGGLALVLAFSGSIVSVVNTTIANAMFLFATAPFIAAVLGRVILGETVRRATWITMAFATAGVAIMVAEGLAAGHVLGNLAALVSALGFALFTIALRSGRDEDMLPAVSLGGLFTVVVAVVLCLVTGQTLLMSPIDMSLAVGLGIFQTGLGLALYTLGSKALPAAELALLAMTEVVLGPIWVWLFLGETAGPYTLAGGGEEIRELGHASFEDLAFDLGFDDGVPTGLHLVELDGQVPVLDRDLIGRDAALVHKNTVRPVGFATLCSYISLIVADQGMVSGDHPRLGARSASAAIIRGHGTGEMVGWVPAFAGPARSTDD